MDQLFDMMESDHAFCVQKVWPKKKVIYIYINIYGLIDLIYPHGLECFVFFAIGSNILTPCIAWIQAPTSAKNGKKLLSRTSYTEHWCRCSVVHHPQQDLRMSTATWNWQELLEPSQIAQGHKNINLCDLVNPYFLVFLVLACFSYMKS